MYLSPEWIAAAGVAMAAAFPASPEPLVLTYVVDGVPGFGRVEYHVAFGPGGARVEPGQPPSTDVTFALDHQSATAIADGRLSAQRAFIDGRLQLSGDTEALLRHRELLVELTDVLAALRSSEPAT